jgi:hypothetical protein
MVLRMPSQAVMSSMMILIGCLLTHVPVQGQIVSWNSHSGQFIDPPTFKLLRDPNAVEYRAIVKQDDARYEVTSRIPTIELRGLWEKIKFGKFTLRFEWVDKQGVVIKSDESESWVVRLKSADWGGFDGRRVDWLAAADRGIAYMLRVAKDGPCTYRQPNVPVWIWEPVSQNPAQYPQQQFPIYMEAFLAAHAQKRPNSEQCLDYATYIADWMMANRRPDKGPIPLFPYSTIGRGKFEGGVEGKSANVLRACYFAIALLEVYERVKKPEYLDYARHIADVTMKFQNRDGSFPYRINPETGSVLEQYTVSSMDFVNLVEALEVHGHDAKRALAARRAIEWLLAYPCQTNLWAAPFEDIPDPGLISRNLSQWAPMFLIRHLCAHRDDDPSYVPLAVKLNRWVEDQFVVFGVVEYAHPGTQKMIRVKGPLVREQSMCFAAMDGHTANWILTLIELHKATGKKVYLDKAMAAANAMCAEQYGSGSFSTWGRDYITGEPDPAPLGAFSNWYSGTCYAVESLCKLDAYVKSLGGDRRY